MRRRCGASTADQKDALATDYSEIVSSVDQFNQFCILAKQVYSTEIASDPLVKDADCSKMG